MFLGTHETEEGAGTDSKIGIELYSQGIVLASKIFDGGCCDNDIILERGRPVSSEDFDFSASRLPDEIKLTLLTPTGNGGHWYGTSVQISIDGHDADLCTSKDIGWLTSSQTTLKLPLRNCLT